jgi:hypothetical protein
VRDWGKLHSEELHSFYSSLNIMRGSRRRRTRRAAKVASKGKWEYIQSLGEKDRRKETIKKS